MENSTRVYGVKTGPPGRFWRRGAARVAIVCNVVFAISIAKYELKQVGNNDLRVFSPPGSQHTFLSDLWRSHSGWDESMICKDIEEIIVCDSTCHFLQELQNLRSPCAWDSGFGLGRSGVSIILNTNSSTWNFKFETRPWFGFRGVRFLFKSDVKSWWNHKFVTPTKSAKQWFVPSCSSILSSLRRRG